MKIPFSLVLASLVLLANPTYAQKAPQHARAKAAPHTARSKPPVITAAPTTNARTTNPNQAPPSQSVVQGNYIGTNAVGTVDAPSSTNQKSTAPTDTPKGFQALTKNEKVKATAGTQTTSPNHTPAEPSTASAPALQQQMQTENR